MFNMMLAEDTNILSVFSSLKLSHKFLFLMTFPLNWWVDANQSSKQSHMWSMLYRYVRIKAVPGICSFTGFAPDYLLKV